MDEQRAAFTRVPPHSLEAEESVLGALLIDPEAFDKIADIVRTPDYYVERHSRIFSAMIQLSESARPIDVITVSDKLKQTGELQRIGGAAYLVELAEKVVTAANIEHYARIIHDKAILRRLIRVSSEILGGAYESRGSTREFIDRAETAIFELSADSTQSALRRIDSLIGPTVERIEQLFEKKQEITGVATGYYDLDKMTAGLQPSDLVVVAGRPSMGKTAFCLNVAEHAAMEGNVGVAVFSMEMSTEQVVMRMLCSQAQINNAAVRTGSLRDRDIKNLALTAGRLGSAPIYIDDAAAQTVVEVRAKARRLKHDPTANLGLIIIDYLQLMRGGGEDSREQEISTISRSLKALAKELSVPVIALSQLNRGVESRTDKRPGMADLRESGAIEQDADVIAFIYRDEQYNPDTAEPGVAEIIIAKQRNGPTGTVRLMFDKPYARFRNFTSREDPQFAGPQSATDGY
ncbi:MAG TPA: replicative DNA helicase [Candidatus Binatia bacterium]|nr:replicative DNA helicase [Candidatus Binatia bacterium]